MTDLHSINVAVADTLTNERKLRIVAVVEAAKGTLVLLLASGLLSLAHGALERAGQAAVNRFHWLPETGLPQMFDRLAESFDSHRLAFALIVTAYIAIRYVEAYGLWRRREWARWLGLIGVAIYIPFELRALFEHPAWTTTTILAFNLLIFWLLWPTKQHSMVPGNIFRGKP